MLFEAAIALAVALVVWLVFIRGEENPVDRLPGPTCYPLIGCGLALLKVQKYGLMDTMISFTKQYGERYKFKILHMRIMHILGPQDIEAVLSHSKNIRKSMPYQFLKDWLGSGLLLSTGSHWHKRRKILTPTFHFNILKNFAPIIEEKCVDLVNMLKEKNGAEVDVMPVISDFTLFTICETAMGTKLDKDQSSASLDYKNAVFNIGNLMLNRLIKFWLFSDVVFKRTLEGKLFNQNLVTAKSFADNVIMDRKANRVHVMSELDSNEDDVDNVGTKRRMAMLDLLLKAEENGDIDMDGIRDEVNTFMFEGHDTTAVALTYALMLLANHEDIQERVYEECQNIFGASNRTATMSDLAEMKYLEAVIKETLRLYPSAPFIGRNIVEDFMLGDMLIKKDTTVDIHIYDLHHREDLFPDAEAFKPERFLNAEPRHPYAYIPFSAGLRNCIGQRFAMQEMKCTLSEIVRNFKLVPKVPGFRPRLMADMVLRPAEPVYIKFIQRER